ncbi:hypothetical protein BDW69DRAFT_192768 [Aspergillus filifer]
MADNKQTPEIESEPAFTREDSPKRSLSPPADETRSASPVTKGSRSAENRLRPAADILNRLIWDESYDSTDFVIGYEDRFKGRMEASLNSWKRELTDEEFIPQHRAIKMPQKRHRIDFSLLRRRQRFSTASSSSLSPTVPVLESPLTFHALAAQEISEATLKQNRFNRLPGKPSMTFENQEDDDDGSIPNLTSGDLKDGRSPRTAHKSSAEERPLTRPKSQFYEESFSSRTPWLTTGTRVGQDSFVVIEIKTNTNSFMIVTIQQIASLRFGNLALPAYSMKIYALPYLIAPITNLRSTILIQAALQDILHIPPSRGIILYIPVPEENMATNNTTMMGEIARLEHDTRGREPGIFKTLSRSLSRRKKSSSAVSAPLSVATTSSWAAGSEALDPKPAVVSESEGINTSVDEGNSRPGKSRTLRLFVSQSTTSSIQTTPGLVTEVQGDLFDAQDGAALIHACNCEGKWGSGIAKVFKEKYPAAFKIYKTHCDKYKNKKDTFREVDPPEEAVSVSTGRAVRHPRTQVQLPEGTALIIKPQQEDYEKEPKKRKHWVICLFTSRGYGKNVDNPDTVLQNTELAIANLEEQLVTLESTQALSGEAGITELRACRINSGNFDVPWDHTKRILENATRNFTVVTRP